MILSWLTENGEVFMNRVEMILMELGKVEDEIFKTRQVGYFFVYLNYLQKVF